MRKKNETNIETIQAQAVAQEVINKTLNGAQTQSLISVVQQYQTGALTLHQAISIISIAIGISKDDARELIGEAVLQSNTQDVTLEARAQTRGHCMNKLNLTEFQKLVKQRYQPKGNATYEEQGDFDWLMSGPLQYENEDKILEYANKHPDITARELNAYWDSITPDGLPPCAADWEDDEDDD